MNPLMLETEDAKKVRTVLKANNVEPTDKLVLDLLTNEFAHVQAISDFITGDEKR